MIFFNSVREEESLMGWGSEFQRVGGATEKALSPQDLRLVRVGGGDRRLAAAEWECVCGGGQSGSMGPGYGGLYVIRRILY